MKEFINSDVLAMLITCFSALALLQLLIRVNKRNWRREKGEKIEIALELFEGNEAAAETWLYTPCKALGHQRPVDVDVEKLRDVVGRLGRG